MTLTKKIPTLSDGTPIEDLFDLDRHEVSLRVMAGDPALHRLEMKQIFSRTWLLLGHECEIPAVGDYVVRDMGEDQVIVARARDGNVYVSLNVCPHRGMRICTGEIGNAQVHRCIYHGWAFHPNGDFLSSPIEREKMHGEIRPRSELGLKKARVHLYGGFVFATWNSNGPSFDDFLGEMKWYYDMLFCRTDKGLELLGPPQRFIVPTNWKAPSEQSAGDGFHTLTAHRSMLEIGLLGADADSIYNVAPAMYGIDVGSAHGHALRCLPAELMYKMFAGRDDISKMSVDERLVTLPPPGMTREMVPELKRRMTKEQLEVLAKYPPQVGGMFPNILIAFIYAPRTDGGHSGALTLHTYQPRGPDKIEFFNYIVGEKDAPPAMKRDLLANSIQQTGTSGTIEQDDSDMWPHITRNARGEAAASMTLKYQAISGIRRPEGWPGGAYVYDGFTKDDTQWNWWMYYRQLMLAP